MKGMRKGTRDRRIKAIIKRRNRHNGGNDGTDRISELPNDILISIISRLPLREATATSVLSSRWLYLHTYATHLNFPPFKPDVLSLFDHSERRKIFDIQRKIFLKYVNMINRVLDSHRGGVKLKELRLCMYRMKGCSMEKWVQFALTKEIEIIDITIPHLPIGYSCFESNARYFLGLSKLMMTTKSILPAIKCLKQLTLHWVSVTDQDFDILISNFLALESLSIRDTFRLKKATIVGHPKLMHVDIPCESLVIRNVANLVSVGVWCLSSEGTIEMENIPKLTELYSCEDCSTLHYSSLYSKIPSNIRDQLQVIRLEYHGYWDIVNGMLPPSIQFVNVKHLELEVKMHARLGLYGFSLLIAACSSLEKLKIKLWRWEWDVRSIKLEERSNSPYYSGKKLSPKLKVLEMEGYAGTQSELKLAAFVTCYAMNLERVIVGACDASDRIQRRSLARAQQDFRLITPPSVLLQFN